MAPWKKPTIPDNISLRNAEEKKLYRDSNCKYLYEVFFKNTSVCVERRLAFDTFDQGELRWIYQRGWAGIMDMNVSASEHYCREFIANIDWKKSEKSTQITSYVRGKKIIITPDIIATELRVPKKKQDVELPQNVERGKFQFGILFDYDDCLTVDWEIISSSICKNGEDWPCSKNTMPKSVIKSEYHYQLEATFSNFLPLIRKSEVSRKRARLLYAITHEIWIDLPKYIFKNLFCYGKGDAGKGGIPYGKLLTKLIREKVGENELFDSIEEPQMIKKSKCKFLDEANKRQRIAQGKGPSRELEIEKEDCDLKSETDWGTVDQLTEELVSSLSNEVTRVAQKQTETNISLKNIEPILQQMALQHKQQHEKIMRLFQIMQKGGTHDITLNHATLKCIEPVRIDSQKRADKQKRTQMKRPSEQLNREPERADENEDIYDLEPKSRWLIVDSLDTFVSTLSSNVETVSREQKRTDKYVKRLIFMVNELVQKYQQYSEQHMQLFGIEMDKQLGLGQEIVPSCQLDSEIDMELDKEQETPVGDENVEMSGSALESLLQWWTVNQLRISISTLSKKMAKLAQKQTQTNACLKSIEYTLQTMSDLYQQHHEEIMLLFRNMHKRETCDISSDHPIQNQIEKTQLVVYTRKVKRSSSNHC